MKGQLSPLASGSGLSITNVFWFISASFILGRSMFLLSEGLLDAPTSARCTRRDPSVYTLRSTHLWYLCNTQFHADLGIPIFADHIRTLTKSFDSCWLVRGGPYFGKAEGGLCRLNSPETLLKGEWKSASHFRHPIKKRPSRHNELSSALFGYPYWGCL